MPLRLSISRRWQVGLPRRAQIEAAPGLATSAWLGCGAESGGRSALQQQAPLAAHFGRGPGTSRSDTRARAARIDRAARARSVRVRLPRPGKCYTGLKSHRYVVHASVAHMFQTRNHGCDA